MGFSIIESHDRHPLLDVHFILMLLQLVLRWLQSCSHSRRLLQSQSTNRRENVFSIRRVIASKEDAASDVSTAVSAEAAMSYVARCVGGSNSNQKSDDC